MEGKRKELYIPVNTPDSEDYITGIGSREVTAIVASLAVAVILGVFWAVIFDVISAVVMAALILASTIMIVRRDAYNENLIKKIKVFRRFMKSPKRFDYCYKNIYESGEEDE